ncbi:hypothetical protein JCM16106_01900 [Hydrogenophilus islandicus]
MKLTTNPLRRAQRLVTGALLLSALLGVALVVGGCASVSPSTEVLTLQPGEFGAGEGVVTQKGAPTIAVSVAVPPTLDRRALTIRQDPSHYRIDERIRWSLPFADEVREAMLARLRLRDPDHRFVADGSWAAQASLMRLHFSLDRFEASDSGNAIVAGRCLLGNKEGTAWERGFSFVVPVPPSPPGTGVAEALQELLDWVVAVCSLSSGAQ